MAAAIIAVVASEAATALTPGESAPAFSLPPLDGGGGRVTLAGQRGKVLYVDFWSAWCAPCRETMPALAALRAKYPRERFEVLGVNVDPSPVAGRRLLRELRLSYPNASDTAGESATMYGVEALPAAFIVDANGIVRHVERAGAVKDIVAIEARVAALIEPEAGPSSAPPPAGTRGTTRQE